MEDGGMIFSIAEDYAYRYYMRHAHCGIGSLSFIMSFVPLGLFCWTMGQALFSKASSPSQTVQCYIVAIVSAICAIGLVALNRHVSVKAGTFAADAVRANGNTNFEDIRAFYDNYPH